jgi:hypothetical protein
MQPLPSQLKVFVKGWIMPNCICQGYDGAANMAGKFSGVRTRIQTEIPEAYYVHRYAHCLNLAVVKSCQLQIVRNTIDTVKDVSYAFHYSSKRTGRFKTI